jgi:uncharacterized protein YeaC (DUF1315 family)
MDNKETIEALSERLVTEGWLFQAAKQKFKWAIGAELTQAEYENCLAATFAHEIKA